MRCGGVNYPITSLSHEPGTWGASRTKDRTWNSSEEEPGCEQENRMMGREEKQWRVAGNQK